MMTRYGDTGVGWGAWVLMAGMMVVFWGAIAWVIVTLIRQGGRNQAPAPHVGSASDPLRILGERFARGEIDEEEYRRRRQALSESP